MKKLAIAVAVMLVTAATGWAQTVTLTDVQDNIVLNGVSIPASNGVPIANGNFQVFNPLNHGTYNDGPIPSWTNTSGVFGSLQPTSAMYNYLPDGPTVAYSNCGIPAGCTMVQDLGIQWQPNTTYTLSGFVGKRLDFQTGDAFSACLAAGTIAIHTCEYSYLNNTSTFVTAGNWALFSFTLTTNAAPSYGGSDVLIQLAKGTNGSAQVNFAGVTLTINAPAQQTVSIPAGVLTVGVDTVSGIVKTNCTSSCSLVANSNVQIFDPNNFVVLDTSTITLANGQSCNSSCSFSGTWPSSHQVTLTHGLVYKLVSSTYAYINNHGPALVTRTITLKP